MQQYSMMLARLVRNLSPKLRFCVTKCHPRQPLNWNQQTRSYASTPSGISRQMGKLQTSIEPNISSEKVADCELSIDGDCLKIMKGSEQLTFDITWLRDHCRCSNCFRMNSWQRMVDPADFDCNLSPDHVTISDDKSKLNIIWSDGHTSSYVIEWLEKVHKRSHKPCTESSNRIFWDRKTLEASPPPDVSFKDYMESEEGVMRLLGNLHKFGIAFMSDVPKTRAVSRTIGERVHSPLKGSIYGGDSDFFPGLSNLDDHSFGNECIPLHADFPSQYDPTGYTVFHYLKQSEIGETTFSDSLRAARILRDSNPELYDALATLPVSFKKIEKGITLHCHTTVFDVRQPNQDPVIIRPTNDDWSVMTLSASEAKLWYAAYSQFRKILTDPDNVYVLKCMPGRMVFLDNWRLAHGRLAFKGERALEAFDWSRDLVDNKLRTAGIIHEEIL